MRRWVAIPHGGMGSLEYIWLQLRQLPGSMPVWEYVPGGTVQEKMEAYNSTNYPLTVQISDYSGKLMREIRVPAGQTTRIETVAWPAGSYVARSKNVNGAGAARSIVKM